MKRITIIAALLLASAAFATGSSNNDPDQEQRQDQDQYQDQGQDQYQGQEVNVTIGGEAGPLVNTASTTTLNDGDTNLDMSDNSRVENNSSNVVLVPNNNTENCLRVWGISWGSSSGSGALGIPWRSAKCDYEQAADDAFAAGERDIGWFWKCQNPNLHKRFKSKGEDRMKASADCLDVMQKGVTQTAMIRELKGQLMDMESQRENDMIEFQRRLLGQKEKCNEISNRIAESCRQGK